MSEVFDINFNERNATGERIWYEQEDIMDEFEQENDEQAAEAEQAEYHRRERLFRCDICDYKFYGTEKSARNQNWSLGSGWAICGRPSHD